MVAKGSAYPATGFDDFGKAKTLDEAAQEKREKRFATEMHVVTRDDRLPEATVRP